MSPTFDAIVVGGGVAGLSAVTALAAAGRRVMLLEARPRLGGRACSFVDPESGEVVDNGQHVLFGCYHDTFALLRRLGTETDIARQDTLSFAVVDVTGRASTFRCPRLPSPWHLLAGVMTWRALSVRERMSVMQLEAPLRRARQAITRGEPLPVRGTVREWLEEHRQAPGLVEHLWAPLAIAALNQDIDTGGAAAFVAVLLALFERRDSASLAWPTKPLSEVFAEPASRFLEAHGGIVRCGARARIRVPAESGSHFRVDAGGQDVSARCVIAAVPWHDLPMVFERPLATTDVPAPQLSPGLDDTLARAARVRASPIVSVNLWCGELAPLPPVTGLPGRTFQWMFDKRAIFDRASHVSMVASAADAIVSRSNAEIAELAVTELRAAVPAVAAASIRRTLVVRERRASFSTATDSPVRPRTATDVAGLFLAGDWVDTGLPATIEGAARSGHRAAGLAVRYLDGS